MLRPSSLRLLISPSPARNLPRRFPPLPLSSPSRTSILTPRHAPKIPFPRNQIAIFSTTSRHFMDPNLIQPDLRKEREERRQAKLEPHPEKVSTTSSLRPLADMGPGEASAQDGDIDMMKGLRTDLKTVKETFALRDVPREVYYFGGAGLVPYVTTSVATMFMAWDIQHAKHTGYAVLFSRETAESIIQFGEPLQVALGAVILSFLGAIHWGLEFANYGGTHPYRRYTIGILAPVLAWPTIMLPFDYALLVQFVGFTGMYFADVQATTWGWAPRWYMTYRFVLTFVVGACIITTLVGRGKV
ncbi:hypothetical protein EX30DRAFT_152253 [Ascodesmis nigricans]|uniref:Uncharacterized protein n=1 Tax=Ascodesmis nigricans TaxID=341454 RepID=A0A4S2N2K8_9PEZI|nr:hypothetical protein EX30DRAFT_152253 [Ascodesmis nigricans]